MSEVQTKPLINISIIGHVDSGKSTLCGRLATKLGSFDDRSQAKLAKIANENSKGSFTFAYFTDRTKVERERGVTINPTLVEMQTSKYRINFIDCPGHADYIKNATTGCKQADLSIVVVPADFEASCSAEGTLKTHLTLAAILGSKNFIVCINKIDEVADKARKVAGENSDVDQKNLKPVFDAAVAAVSKFLKKLGVDLKTVIFLPISALHGIGLFKGDKKYDFFQGYVPPTPVPGFDKITCLEEAIDYQKAPERPTKQSLRLPVSSTANVPGQGTIVCGRVDYGTLRRGMNIKILPLNLVGEVKNIQAHKADVEAGEAGMNIGFSLKIEDKAKTSLIDKVTTGSMVGETKDESFTPHPFYLVSCVSMKGKGSKGGQEEKGIRPGYTPVISCGTSNVASKFVKIVSAIDKETNTALEVPPSVISKDQRFTALIYPTKSALFESYKSFPTLGKFVCRDSGVLVAVGQVLEALTEQQAVERYNVSMAEVTGVKPANAGADKKGKKK